MATAFGPVLGGLLVGVAPWGWRLVFLINLPLAVFVIIVGRSTYPRRATTETRGRVDGFGAVLAARAWPGRLRPHRGPANGWGRRGRAPYCSASPLLAGFLVLESRPADPLMPLGLFRARQFSAANAVTFAVYAALSGGLFLLPVSCSASPGSARRRGQRAAADHRRDAAVVRADGPARHSDGPRIPDGRRSDGRRRRHRHVGLPGATSTYLTGVLPPMLVFGLGLSVTVAPLTATALAAAPDTTPASPRR